MLSHRDLFDLGVSLAQLIYPSMEHPRFLDLIISWCAWRFWHFRKEPSFSRAELKCAELEMAKRNCQILRNEMAQLSMLPRDVNLLGQESSFDARKKINEIIADDRNELYARIRSIKDTLGVNCALDLEKVIDDVSLVQCFEAIEGSIGGSNRHRSGQGKQKTLIVMSG